MRRSSPVTAVPAHAVAAAPTPPQVQPAHLASATGSHYLLTIPEAVKELCVSRAQVFRMIARGELASIRNGRRRLIPIAAVEQYIAERMQQGTEGAA